MLEVPVNNFSVISGRLPDFLVRTCTKQRIKCSRTQHSASVDSDSDLSEEISFWIKQNEKKTYMYTHTIRGSRGGRQGVRTTPPPPENHKSRVSYQYWSRSPENHKAPSLCQHRHASETSLAFRSSLPTYYKKSSQSWTPSDKTVWIRVCHCVYMYTYHVLNLCILWKIIIIYPAPHFTFRTHANDFERDKGIPFCVCTGY